MHAQEFVHQAGTDHHPDANGFSSGIHRAHEPQSCDSLLSDSLNSVCSKTNGGDTDDGRRIAEASSLG
jgi:hypothetical protein